MINISNFIHPDDAAALDKLKSIPALPNLIEKVFQYGYEEISWSNNVTSNVRLSEYQMPEIYDHLPPICAKLGIPVPELYLQMSPIPNAWTSGCKRVYIVVTLGLVRRFKNAELDAVLAHECGHILCQHVLYSMLANAIYDLGDTVMDSFFGTIGNVAMKPIKQALMSWSRASELSADRIGGLITSADTMARVLAKLDGIPEVILKDMNYDAWADQGADYEQLKNGDFAHKFIRYMSNTDLTHPYGPVRAYEVKRWENSQEYLVAKQNIQLLQDGKHCPKCGSLISSDWSYCRSCGNKL